MIRKSLPVLVVLAVSALAVPRAWAQDEALRRGRPVEELGAIRVKVRSATGAPLATHAIVRISQRVGPITYTESTIDAASVEFKGLPVGDYVIEVSSAGYHPATEEATLFSPSGVMQVYILLQPESAPGAVAGSGPPVLAPKARKEVQDAIAALENNDLGAAEKHLQRAEKMAPGHPEIHYLFGLLLAKKNDVAGARQRFEKAVALYPQHAAALGALGRLSLREGDLNGAVSEFERALVADARSHENHAALAAIFFEQKNLEKAKYHAEQALDIAGGKLPGTRLLLSQILMAQGDRLKAAEVLKQFLVDYPDHRDAAAVRRMRAALVSNSTPATTEASPQPAAGERGGAARQTIRITQAGARVLSLASLTPELAPGAIIPPPLEWAPKDIDATPPAIFPDVTCSQGEVLKRAGQRVADLISHLGDVNAAERITHISIDGRGRPGRVETGTFEYMFSYRRPRDGVIWVEEFRDGLRASPRVGGVGTSGYAAMALVFHPAYSGDFEMKCVGQGSWKGEAVWYVRFQQRGDRPPRMRSFVTSSGTAGLRFKGRAWIAANSYQIVRLETDVIQPPRNLRFESEHMVIEYASTRFKKRKLTFWLPVSVDIYAHEGGKRWHRNHSLANYVHFAVDTKQKIKDPDVPDDPTQPPLP